MKEGSAGLPWTSFVLYCKETLSGPWTEAISRSSRILGNLPRSSRRGSGTSDWLFQKASGGAPFKSLISGARN